MIKKHEEHKAHLSRKSKSESDFPFQPNATLPETIDNTFICTKDNSCPVCSLPGPGLLDSVENSVENEESPSKKIKIDDEPKMSPRDKLNPQKSKKDQKPSAGRLSMWFGLQKGHFDAQGGIILKDEENIKIYIDKNNFHNFHIF